MAAFRSDARRNARLGAARDRYGFAGIPRVSGRVKREESSTAAHTYRRIPHLVWTRTVGKGNGGSRGGGQFLLPPPPPPSPLPRVIIRGEWTISGAAATARHRLVMPRTLYTNDSVRRVLYDFVVLRAAIVFPWSIRPVANQRSPLSRERSFSPSIRARLKGQLARRPTARVTIPINLFRDSEILRSAIFHKEGGRSLRRIQSCVRLDERPTGRVCTSEIGRRNEASVFLSILSSVPPSLVVSSRRRGRTKLGCEAMDIVARPPKRSFVLIVSRGSIANDQSWWIFSKARAFWFETIRLSQAWHGHVVRATLNPIAISPNAGTEESSPLLLSTRAVRYTHATAIRLDGGHTITRLLIAGRSCTPRLVFAYLVCQCCIDHLRGGRGERRGGMTSLCRRTVSGRGRQRRGLEDDWEGDILCNEIPRRFHTRMQIPSSIELCRLSCRGQNERIPGFRGKRMEEKKRKGEKRKKKRIESLTHPGVGYALVGLAWPWETTTIFPNGSSKWFFASVSLWTINPI